MKETKNSKGRAILIRVLSSEWTAIAVVSFALWISLRGTSNSDTRTYTPSTTTSSRKSPSSPITSTTSNSFTGNSKQSNIPRSILDSEEAPKSTPKKVSPQKEPSSSYSSSTKSAHRRSPLLLPLRPQDLPPPVIFDAWEGTTNETIYDLPGRPEGQSVARGSIQQTASTVRSKFSVLPAVIPKEKVSQILRILHGTSYSSSQDPEHGPQTAVPLDTEPDSVDGMNSQEIFLDNDSLRQGLPSKSDPNEDMTGRASIRAQLRNILDPILEDVLTPYVRRAYPNACQKGNGRFCTPCYSLIRRYHAGERISHAPHHDKHSLVTVVVSLSDYNVEYTGGLYVSTMTSRRNYIALNRGDAIIHQGDLYHGVQLIEKDQENRSLKTERWSWILWYRDSETCDDHSLHWYADCAEEDENPTCQYLMANFVDNIHDTVTWNQRAAEQGHGAACVKLARAYLKLLSSDLPLDPDMAKTLYQRAIDSVDEPDGHYGLASMNSIILHHLDREMNQNVPPDHPLIRDIIQHLESAAMVRHPFAMFNLGIVHSYGYGDPNAVPDPKLGAEWFEASGLPEGFAARAQYEASLGNHNEANKFRKRAEVLGYGSPVRVMARKATGYGGAGGVELNLYWPALPNGDRPPHW